MRSKAEISRLQVAPPLSLTEVAHPLRSEDVKEVSKRVINILQFAPLAGSLEQQYEWDKALI